MKDFEKLVSKCVKLQLHGFSIRRAESQASFCKLESNTKMSLSPIVRWYVQLEFILQS